MLAEFAAGLVNLNRINEGLTSSFRALVQVPDTLFNPMLPVARREIHSFIDS